MLEIMTYLGWGFLVAFGVLNIVVQPIHWKFLRRLKREFPTYWAQLGKPNFWTEQNVWASWRHIKYVWHRSYLSTQDTDAISFFEGYRLLLTYGYFSLVTSGILFIGFMAIGGLIELIA